MAGDHEPVGLCSNTADSAPNADATCEGLSHPAAGLRPAILQVKEEQAQGDLPVVAFGTFDGSNLTTITIEDDDGYDNRSWALLSRCSI